MFNGIDIHLSSSNQKENEVVCSEADLGNSSHKCKAYKYFGLYGPFR